MNKEYENQGFIKGSNYEDVCKILVFEDGKSLRRFKPFVKVMTIGLNPFFWKARSKYITKIPKKVGGSRLVCELQALV